MIPRKGLLELSSGGTVLLDEAPNWRRARRPVRSQAAATPCNPGGPHRSPGLGMR